MYPTDCPKLFLGRAEQQHKKCAVVLFSPFILQLRQTLSKVILLYPRKYAKSSTQPIFGPNLLIYFAIQLKIVFPLNYLFILRKRYKTINNWHYFLHYSRYSSIFTNTVHRIPLFCCYNVCQLYYAYTRHKNIQVKKCRKTEEMYIKLYQSTQATYYLILCATKPHTQLKPVPTQHNIQ